jgi:hypothetical protein
MNRIETALFCAFAICYFLAFGLYHLMIYRVNHFLPADSRIRHRTYLGGWSELRVQYLNWFPRSQMYRIALACAVTSLSVAVLFALFRVWEYATNR